MSSGCAGFFGVNVLFSVECGVGVVVVVVVVVVVCVCVCVCARLLA